MLRVVRVVSSAQTGGARLIDSVMLAQSEANKPLLATLEVSTYYRIRANGS